MWQQLFEKIKTRDIKSLARAISLVENEQEGYEQLLTSLEHDARTKIIGITGPPGAGKSTLTDALIKHYVEEGMSVAVVCVDPSSPFNLGALLGDRIRMNAWYLHPSVYIRSLATRGSMGGLSPKIIEITDILKTASFDIIIVETVGVGQSEIDIAGLADVTVVVMVPEAGDEIQTMKAGLMEIADVFVINKSDRPGADVFAKNLRSMFAPAFAHDQQDVQVVKTIAHQHIGIEELANAIARHHTGSLNTERKKWLLTEKAYYLIMKYRMRDIEKTKIKTAIEKEFTGDSFNLYRFAQKFY